MLLIGKKKKKQNKTEIEVFCVAVDEFVYFAFLSCIRCCCPLNVVLKV